MAKNNTKFNIKPQKPEISNPNLQLAKIQIDQLSAGLASCNPDTAYTF